MTTPKFTLEDIRWLKHVQDYQRLGRGGEPLPELNKRKLLTLGLVDEKLGNLVLTKKGLKLLAFHR
jgi:hypothetical protein